MYYPGAVGMASTKAAAQSLKEWSAYLGEFWYTVQTTGREKKCLADVFDRRISELICESKLSYTFITAAELFDGDTGGLPRKDSIQGCQQKATHTA